MNIQERRKEAMKKDVNSVLYQKKGVTISHVASSLLSRSVGDRIPSISEYQQEFGVSRVRCRMR